MPKRRYKVQEKVLAILKEKGPLKPSEVIKELNEDEFAVREAIFDLAYRTHKVGFSPDRYLYLLP
jgi:hypothetical protein